MTARKKTSLRYSQQMDARLEDWSEFLGTNKNALVIYCVHQHLNRLENQKELEEVRAEIGKK